MIIKSPGIIPRAFYIWLQLFDTDRPVLYKHHISLMEVITHLIYNCLFLLFVLEAFPNLLSHDRMK